MIKYSLQCAEDHRFEGWFSSSDDYDDQQERGLLSCPVCGTSDVKKALMAPAIATSRRREAREARTREVVSALNESARRARDYVEKNFDHVGKNFPEEARKVHYGEVEREKPIYGDATVDEAKALKDEGIEIAPVPAPIPSPDETKTKLN